MRRLAPEAGDTLLVIDDDPQRRAALEANLKGRHTVRLADVASARKVLASTVVDLALAAVGGGGTGAFDALRAVRMFAPDAEVIAFCDRLSDSLLEECLRYGATDVLEYPRDLPRLGLAVGRALHRRRLAETEALYEASRELMDARTPEDLSARLAALVKTALLAEEAELILCDERGRLPPELIPEAPPALREEALQAVALRRPLVLESGQERADASRWAHRLLLPLAQGEQLVGAIVALRADARRPFRASDLAKASLLGAQARLALRNVRLTQELVRTERFVAMGELLAGVSHEINNPLAFVRSNLRFVTESLDPSGERPREDPAELKAALHDAEEGLERIAALLGDLKVLGRMDSSRHSAVDVREVVGAAVRLAGSELKRCNVVVEVPEGLWVQAEPGRLGQLLVNLLLNAAQAVASGPSSKRNVRISASAIDGQCVVEVADSGPGVPVELRERIFEPFFTTHPDGRGAGLGLALARRIAEGHGGTLVLRPQPDEGATFELRLPLASGNA